MNDSLKIFDYYYDTFITAVEKLEVRYEKERN